MSSALEAFAGADFQWTKGLREVWTDSPHHVDSLHGDLVDRIVAEFFARTRAPSSNPIGQILMGRAGSGKTHLIGTLRRRVWEGGGWFVLIDIVGGGDFWSAAALAFVESLARPMKNGRTQAEAVLIAVMRQLKEDPAARRAAAALPLQGKPPGVIETLIAMLGAAAPAEARRFRDVVRALILLESRDMAISGFAAMWLEGHEGDDARRRELGFLAGPPAPVEIVGGLLWIMSFGGPTLIAVDQIDAIVSEANAGDEGGKRANAILQTIAGGLMDLHDVKRRALTLVSCLEATWPLLKQRVVASAADRFRELQALPPVASVSVVERLIAGRLASAYKDADFAPPYPTYPFARTAIESAVGLRPRAILMRSQEHLDVCLAAGRISECESLARAPSVPSLAAPPGDEAALDKAFESARAAADPPPLDDEPALAALLSSACELYLRQLKLPESVDGEAPPEPNPNHPSLHARLAFTFHDENDRQRRWSFRFIGQDNPIAFQSRLKAAITASGLEPGILNRRLIVLRDAPPPGGPKTGALIQTFLGAGGQFLSPSRADFVVFAALRQLAAARRLDFEAWLRTRKPLFATGLFQKAGLAPPDFLADAPAPPPVPSASASAPEPRSRPAPQPAVAATSAPSPRQPELPAQREIYIGRSVQLGETLGPVTLPVGLLPRHVVILAGSGTGKSVLLSRIVEEAALAGAPAVVLDVNNDLARLGEAWPSRPAEFSDDDARKARAFFERAEVVVWTPGVSAGRPMSLRLLPDFAALGRGGDPESVDERERAIEMAHATLAPFLPRGGAKAIKLQGALADGLRAFARAGGGSLDDLVRLLADLPETASRLSDAPKLGRDLADQLLAAMATHPLLRGAGETLDPALLFSGESGKPRISVVNLSGLGSDEARQSFVNQLQMTLFAWIKDHPSPSGRLYVLDEAQTYAPARETTACKKSALTLVKQARKYGLGMIFATQEPRGIDQAIVSNCVTHLYGRFGSPASLEAVKEMMAAKGGAADDLGRLKVGEFYFSTEGLSRPTKIRAPLCLSRRTQNPPTTEEVAAIARRGLAQERNSAK